MARRQTRRTVSLSRSTYARLLSAANAENKSCSEYVEDALIKAGLPIERGIHLDKATREYKRADGTPIRRPRPSRAKVPLVIISHTTPEPPRITRAEPDAIAQARRAPRPGDPAPHAKSCAWGVTCAGPFVLSTYDDKLVPACAEHAEEADGETTDRTWRRRA